MAPNKFSPFLSVSFRRGVESRDPIFPASGLQLSFERPECDQEIFVERFAACDVHSSESGLCTVSLPKHDMPKYSVPKGREATVGDVVVKLHAWKGDRHLGAWEVGRLSGHDAYRVVG